MKIQKSFTVSQECFDELLKYHNVNAIESALELIEKEVNYLALPDMKVGVKYTITIEDNDI